jgi:hypothetical protein
MDQGRLELPPCNHSNGCARGAAKPASPPVLLPDQSAVLRDRLLVEISQPCHQRTASRTGRSGALAAKNHVTASDARLLEVASMHSRPQDIPANRKGRKVSIRRRDGLSLAAIRTK